MLLKYGSEGEMVKKLQIKLGIDPVGRFGPKTEEAVKDWQTSHGLTPDGIVGPETWGKIFGEEVSSKPTLITEPAPVSSINIENLRGYVPDDVIDMIPDTMSKFQINTKLRLAHFLAQCAHESGEFEHTRENLNYSAKGLLSTFGKYFPTRRLAEHYERKPESIASRVYGGRMGNGPESTKEGYKFRGRGYIQLTGKENYTAFSKAIGEDIVSNPDKVATDYPLLSAAWFFHKNALHKIADEGSNNLVVTKITKRINGGTIGLSDRINHFKKFYNLL